MKLKEGYEIFGELILNAERMIVVYKAKKDYGKVEELKRQIEAYKKVACEEESE